MKGCVEPILKAVGFSNLLDANFRNLNVKVIKTKNNRGKTDFNIPKQKV